MKEPTNCGILIRQINNTFEKKANNRLKEQDLTFSQMNALMEILNMPAGKTTFKELEKRLSLAQSTTVGLISRLELKKLVSVSGDQDDKRIKYVEITALGEKFCNEAKQEMEDTQRKLLEDFSAEEVETLLSLLRKINRKIAEI